MNTKHALTLKGFAALLLGVTVMATSCKKDDSELTSPNGMSDSTLSASVKTDGIMATATVSGSNLLTNSTFEETDALSKWQSEKAYANSITRASGIAKTGSYSAKFTINKSDPLVAGSYRAELKNEAIPKFAERWYGFNTYLPSTFTADPVPESIFQWHNVPNFSAGETWGTPRITPLHVQTVNGRYKLVHALSSVPNDPKSPQTTKSYDLGAYQTGVWTDWVLHIKFTWQNDGIIEIWKNGVKVLTINGQTYYNDDSGPYLKFGLYKWGWSGTSSTVSTRTIYFDNFNIGGANSSYNDVATGSTTVAPAPAPEPAPAPAPAPNSVVFAVNAGGSSYTAGSGITYQSDKNYSGGSTFRTSSGIGGTPDDALYQSERFGTFGYAIPVSNGTYEITFKFAEIFFNSTSARQFDILLEGKEEISNLNIAKVVGFLTKYDIVKTVSVTDGVLNIQTRNDLNNAKISAFHVIKK